MKPEEQPPIVIAHGQANAEWVSDGEPSLTRNHEAPIVAFSSKDSGLDAVEDLSPTLRLMNNKDSNMNGGGQVAIAFKPSHFTRDKEGTNNRSIATPTCVRRLTPTECLRLQGLPDDWLSGFEFSDTVKYRQIGNSVAVPVFEWVAKRIAAALRK
jgi:DNA (cytosine-5)-methyltransferase 1